MRRATGPTISALPREVVTGPLGIEDEVHFGVPGRSCPGLRGRSRPVARRCVSRLDRRRTGRCLVASCRTLGTQPRVDVLTCNIPSEGTMTARGVARMYSALLGLVDGARLVSGGRLAAMAAAAFTGMDEVMDPGGMGVRLQP